MPGWIWILLVIFLLLVLVAGAIYVFRHAKAAIGLLTPLVHRAQTDMDAINRASQQPVGEREPIVLDRSLADVRQDYENAHVRLLQHKNERRARRDAERWPRWRDFGTAQEHTDDPQVRAGRRPEE